MGNKPFEFKYITEQYNQMNKNKEKKKEKARKSLIDNENKVKQIVWAALTEYAERYNVQGYKKENMTEDTELLKLFPSEPTKIGNAWVYCDEQANRCGITIADTILYLKYAYEVNIMVGYDLRTEFITFKTLGDVFIYISKKMIRLEGKKVETEKEEETLYTPEEIAEQYNQMINKEEFTRDGLMYEKKSETEKPFEILLWDVVVLTAAHFSAKDISPNALKMNTPTSSLFENNEDSLEYTLLNIVSYFRTNENVENLTLNVERELQFQTFKTIGDIYLYFTLRIKGIDEYIFATLEALRELEDSDE